MPILHLAQLLGAAAGIREDELKFKRHVVRLSPRCRTSCCGPKGPRSPVTEPALVVRARRGARRPARPARRGGRAALRPRRDRGRPQPVRLEGGAEAGAVARGGVRALARAHRGRRGRARRRHRGQPRLRAVVGSPRRSRSCPGRTCATREATRRGRAPVRVAVVPAPARAAEGRRAAAALAAAAARARSSRTGRRAGAAGCSWRPARTSSPSASRRCPTASTS